jgi:hypothetical protein
MKQIKLIAILTLLCNSIYGQLTLSNGKHVLELSGSASTYFNYRDLKLGQEDNKKNRFKLRDAQIQLEGRIGHIWEYELQVDFSDIAANDLNAAIDTENPGLMEAKVVYKGLSFMNVELGYGKLYYSRSSLTPFQYSPYWQREQINRDLFSRRDVGVTVTKDFLNQQFNVALGVYTGLGESSLLGDNDASGNMQYVGRVDYSYPSRFRYRMIDDKISPVPMFSIGANGRYANKALPTGEIFPQGALGEYGMKVLNGEQIVYGFDFAAQYMGFSTQFEIHQMRGNLANPQDQLFQGLSPSQTKGYFLAGGWVSQVSYFAKDWKTIFSIRYEEMDFSDLVKGRSKRYSPAIAYQIDGFNAMIKAQYFGIINEEPLDTLKWNKQFRIGIQFMFK